MVPWSIGEETWKHRWEIRNGGRAADALADASAIANHEAGFYKRPSHKRPLISTHEIRCTNSAGLERLDFHDGVRRGTEILNRPQFLRGKAGQPATWPLPRWRSDRQGR